MNFHNIRSNTNFVNKQFVRTSHFQNCQDYCTILGKAYYANYTLLNNCIVWPLYLYTLCMD